MPTPTCFTHLSSPVGTLMIAAAEDGLRAVEFPASRHPVPRHGTWLELKIEDLARPDGCADSRDSTWPQNASANPKQESPESRHTTRHGLPGEPSNKVTSLLTNTCQQLTEYFAGKRQLFELPLAPQGTPFQKQVWQALCEIPYGQTWHYGQLARHIGNPRAVRAVGAANGRNPIAIIIPCHRVIGANGTLVGFGGGLDTKARLLALESAQQNLMLMPDA